ncbi:GH92 family glycosyl hydrolase [Terriglobus sp. 2YAB30_2]|uniref:GH92 family glycosyl hydrolase n=1 Tax=unclassified Terriglobus TaxID=2628988 RepID=UPI003F94A6C2
MITRRSFLGSLSAVSAGLAVADALPLAAFAKSPASSDVTKYVKIAIGTGGHGHTYPGATMPWGAVQLSPDTGVKGWDHCSGYHWDDKTILGFSHTHLSGTGAADLLDFLVVPRVGAVKLAPSEYQQSFSHDEEVSRPGYYSVKLKDSGIFTELSATERCGVHRYTFPESKSATIMLDMTHLIEGNPQKVNWAKVKVEGRRMLTGGRSTQLWSPGREIYFAMEFSRPADSIQIFADDKLVQGETSNEPRLKVVAHFHTTAGEKILVKTGISGISTEGALANLKAEVPHWDFDAVQHKAHQAWQQALGAIQVETENTRHKEIFYTGLYHTMLAPTLFDDVTGKYAGMDGKVHDLPAGLHNYSTFSLWDTYRALHPLYTLIAPEKVPDLVNCLIREAEQSPGGVPIWPLQQKETFCMVGYHSAPVVAEALVKGFQGIDAKAAYKVFRKRAMVDDYRGLGAYRKYGYIPCDVEEENASKTMDYAYDDSAVAAIAKAAGEQQESEQLHKRSKNYRNLYDKETGFIRPKYTDGRWAGPFAPNAISVSRKWRDYTESNAWVTTFSVQHDPNGLAELMGGKQALEKKLDDLFSADSTQPPDMPPDVAGLVGQYAHGNEPSHHIVYLYNYAGVPEKAQKRLRSLMETMYDNKPNGMQGNEDCGQMSAWYVLSALGIYPVDPVSATWDVGTPLFDRATLEVGNGKTLTIETKRSSADAAIVKSITFNGEKHEGLTFEHAALAKGGKIVFEMA